MISWLMFIIVAVGFVAPIALATQLTTVLVSRRSYMTIACGSAIATAAIACASGSMASQIILQLVENYIRVLPLHFYS